MHRDLTLGHKDTLRSKGKKIENNEERHTRRVQRSLYYIYGMEKRTSADVNQLSIPENYISYKSIPVILLVRY